MSGKVNEQLLNIIGNVDGELPTEREAVHAVAFKIVKDKHLRVQLHDKAAMVNK